MTPGTAILRLRRRWFGDSSAPVVRMWTVQTAEAYGCLVGTGILRPDPALADPDFAHAYRWMQEQADRRLPTTGSGMLWLWARIRPYDLAAQMRRSRGEVLLEVEMPRERVLMSDFGTWHQVLNTSLVVDAKPGEDVDVWFARADRIEEDFEARLRAAGLQSGGMRDVTGWPPDLRAEIERSWESILDPSQWDATSAVQAVVHEIASADVVRVTRL